MDFRNVNSLNSRANALSGNLLPMTPENSGLSIGWRIYCVIVLLIEVAHTTALMPGLILVPREKALKDGAVGAMLTIEVIVILTRFHVRKKLLKQVIRTLNDLLRNADETMKDIVKSALKPMILPFTLYGVSSVIPIVVWTGQPILLAFERDTFYYTDYKFPAAFCAEPFSAFVLIWSTIIMTVGSVTRFLKKYSLDIYMVHLVILLTAQYRYIATKLAQLFRDPQKTGNGLPETDRCVKSELRTLCQHYNTVMRISFMLRELLSSNFSLIYLTGVFRFCFLGLMMTTVPSLNLMGGISVLIFALSSLTHFFLLCSFVQSLLDASTEISDKAFHESWYRSRTTKQRTFLFFIMANSLDCKLAAIDKFNLSLPSFITVMNQSYSFALLFLRVK